MWLVVRQIAIKTDEVKRSTNPKHPADDYGQPVEIVK